MKIIRTILLTVSMMACSSVYAQTFGNGQSSMVNGQWSMVNGQLTDSIASAADDEATPVQGRLLTSKIRLLTRPYGDRVALRWLPEDYVSWMFLCHSGFNVLRVDAETHQVDTVAMQLKPLTQQQFEAKYPQSDSLAMVALGVLYGEGKLGENQTREKPGSQGANVELNNDQALSFAYAMLVAEWRPDLAEAMAVGITDRTARRGRRYDYYVQPSTHDFGGKIIFEPGVDEGVVNTAYKPEPYDPKLQYEQVSPRRVGVSWIDLSHSSFEIERRQKGGGAWQRLNDQPYLSMVQDIDIDGFCLYSDSVSTEGTWEYRVLGHDAFGELTEPSPVLTAQIRDIEAPRAPQLKYIVIERPEDDPMARVLAHVVWQTNEPLEKDLQGYVLHYYNERITGHRWMPLGEALIAPADTMATVDVTGLRTGMISVFAYDDSGNIGQSLPQLIRLTDYKAPAAPDSLRALTLPDGYVILSWQPSPEDNDIAYYDVAFANDSTHEFLTLNRGGIQVPMYVDTLALDVNQKYVYYRVRAVDTENNFGEWSPILQVLRPHDTPPSTAHLDESWHNDEQGMHMRWIVGTDADMTYHLLLRRLGTDGDWETLAVWDADSIAAAGDYAVTVDDNPPYNQEQRYYYMVESHNSTPHTSASMAVSWLHRGPRVLDIPVSLSGGWVDGDKVVRLVWDAQLSPSLASQDYYYCVFRKGQQDKRFHYMQNVAKGDREYTDQTLRPGEQADYYVSIRFKDGRESQNSNTITVRREH